MAFPFQTTHLLAHLRASYLTLADDPEYAKRVIKPLQLSDQQLNHEINGGLLNQTNILSHSPPIVFNLGRQVHKSYFDQHHQGAETLPTTTPNNGHQRHRQSHLHPKKHRKKRSSRRLRPRSIKEEETLRSVSNPSNSTRTLSPPAIDSPFQRKSSATSLESSPNATSSGHFKFRLPPSSSKSSKDSDQENPEPAPKSSSSSANKFGLSYTKTIRAKGIKTNSIVKFFQPQQKSSSKFSNNSDSDSDSDGSIKTHLEMVGNPPKELELIEEERRRHPQPQEPNPDKDSDVLTIDSDFGVPVSDNGDVFHNSNSSFADAVSDNRDSGSSRTEFGASKPHRRYHHSVVNSLKQNTNNDDNFFGAEVDEDENDYEDESAFFTDDENVNDLYDDDEDDDDEDDDDDVDDDDEEEDDDDDVDDVSSTDSAFTDMETDSLIDSSSLLESYNHVGGDYSFGNTNDNIDSLKSYPKNQKRKKSKAHTFDGQSLSRTAISGKSLTSQNNFLSSTFNNTGHSNNTNGNNNSNPGLGNNQNLSTLSKSNNDPSKDPASLGSSVATHKSYHLPQKKSGFLFEKRPIDKTCPPKTSPEGSNLSLLIQSRSKSTNTNPLQYYSFVNSDIEAPDVHKAKTNIFIPPSLQAIIVDLTMNDNVAISDCIGYILLCLSKLEDYKYICTNSALMNPNHWRLEMADEDGESLGSFGVLDRARLLSSYNSPKHLAICKIENSKEIAAVDKKHPLPSEFKASLDSFEKRQQKLNSILDDETSPIKETHHATQSTAEKEQTIELKIQGPSFLNSSNEFMSYFVPLTSTVEELMEKFVADHKIDRSKYKFRQLVPSEPQRLGSVGHNQQTLLHETFPGSLGATDLKYRKPLAPTDLIAQLESHTLELVPAAVPNAHLQQETQPSSSGQESFLNSGITPSNSLSLPGITPPVKKQLEDRFHDTNKNGASITSIQSNLNASKKANTTERIKRQVNSNKYLDDIISGRNSQIPKSLNDIYLKWKVWRKKPTILNKIEKSLIIDGDYIHLTPTEDTTWKKNPLDNPFSSSNQAGHGSNAHGHHHHHLHHYNYSNYYNKSMMKTSSFHITQITKLKQYKNSKNPNHFKIVIKKEIENDPNAKDNAIKKKYDLEAVSPAECEDIINKIKYVLQIYNMSNMNLG